MIATPAQTVAGQSGSVASTTANEPEMGILGTIAEGQQVIAVMNPAAMKRLFFVSTYGARDPDSQAPKQHGYQREPMTERLNGIAKYFAEEGGRPTPIIVSVRLTDHDDIEEFEELFNEGRIDEIHHRWHKAIVSVVDGQHRYLGLVRAQEKDPSFNPMVAVQLNYGLEFKTEAEMFDIINSTQRKLPKALIEVTAGDIVDAGKKTHAQMVREIAFSLARDKDSVWYNQVNMTGARDPKKPVTYEGLRRSTANMFTNTVISRLQGRMQRNRDQADLNPEQVAKDYWRLVSEACAPAWKNQPRPGRDPETGKPIEIPVEYRIKDLVGVAALAKLGHDIITSCLEHKDFKGEMVGFVSKLNEVDWEKRPGNPWVASQAGFAGQKDLYDLLHALVYLDERPGEAHDA